MAPQWMPQNIQKRLLRYVLQQLSLFSEIDLPNLDVTLGTSSKIVLRELQLDPDKISIPGVFVRDGKVDQLELLLAVGGGVNIEAQGVEITLAPSLNSSDLKKSKFSLAQSTADLANSIMVDTYDDDVVEDHDDDIVSSSSDSIPNKLGPETANNSRLNAVMARAAELALARLKVDLRNINITIISDSFTIQLHIEQLSFNTTDGIRNVTFNGIDAVLISPNAPLGDSKEPPAKEPESESESEEEDNYSDDDNDMMSSSILDNRKESLMDSMVFSHEEASSLYMSATSNFAKSSFVSAKSQVEPRLFYINSGEISFQGFQDIEDSNISIDEIKIAATPWPTALTGFLQTLSRIRKLNNLQNNPKPKPTTTRNTTRPNVRIDLGTSIQNDDNESVSDDDDVPLFFDNLSVNTIVVDINSALSQTGEFLTDDSIRLHLETIKIAQESVDNYKGFIDTIKAYQLNKLVLNLDQTLQIDEADLIFKYKKFVSTLTDTAISLTKPVLIDLDSDFMIKLFKFITLLQPLKEFKAKESASSSKLLPLINNASTLRSQIDPRRYNHQPRAVPSSSSKLAFKTEPIQLKFALSSDISFNCVIFPISYDSPSELFNIDQISIKLIIDGIEKNLVDMVDFKYQSFAKDEIVRTFDIISSGKFEVSNILTLSKLDIKSIELTGDLGDINRIRDQMSILLDSISNDIDLRKTQNVEKSKKRVRLNNTTLFQKSLASFISLNSLKFNINKMNEKFGGVSAILNNLTFKAFRDSSLYQLFVMDMSLSRTENGTVKEQFFGIANLDDNNSPIIGTKLRDHSVLNIYLRNVLMDYYTQWLTYLDNGPRPEFDLLMQVEKMQSAPPVPPLKRFEIRTTFSDCVIGLNPSRLASKALVVIYKGNADVDFASQIWVRSSLKSLSFLLIDDTANILSDTETKSLRQWNNLRNTGNSNATSWSQVSSFVSKGYVSVANLNLLHSTIVINNEQQLLLRNISKCSLIDMKINTDAWLIELCADSAQCLTQLLNDLKLPVNITFDDKYKPSPDVNVNIFDDIEEFAFEKEITNSSKLSPNTLKSDQSIVESYYGSNKSSSESIKTSLKTGSINNPNEDLDATIEFNENHFENNSSDTSEQISNFEIYPLSIYVGISKAVLNLYDGYDWEETRKTISGAIERVQAKANQVAKIIKDDRDPPSRGSTRRDSFGDMGFLPDFSGNGSRMVGETLYDSIILSFPVGLDAGSLTDNINRDLGVDDDSSVLESPTSTAFPSRGSDPSIDLGKFKGKKVRLQRSKYQKVSVELFDLDFEMTIFTNYDPSRDGPRADDSRNKVSETVNSMEIKVRDFYIADNVPTSTWNRFATYMTEAGIREIGVSMFRITMDTVRPIASLSATELILDVHVLPLSLHVDQDTLDFLARFGEFKDSRFLLVDPYEDVIYIQKFSVNSVKIKLDYKPKKIDYNGIRSGHTSEFMNFFILDEAEMVLRNLSLYGISGFPRLNKMLNDCWMPDIKSNQLSGVLAGLAPVRSIVQIGSGFKDLVAVPVKEYKKDGRAIRSLQQGAFVFAKTTSNELLKFGVKLAAGTQTALENAEGALGGEGSSGRLQGYRREEEVYGLPEEEQVFAITDARSIRKNGRERPNIEASLIGKSAYIDSIDPVTRRGLQSQKVLDPFQEFDESDEEFSLRSHSGQAVSGRKFDIDDIVEDDSLSNNDSSLNYSMDDDERQKFVSLYADQPHNMREGLQAAYSSLGRNFSTAKDALREAGASISDTTSAKAALMAMAKAAPVAVIRPIIGTTEAISKALLGGMNQLDPSQRLKAEEKYKSAR